MSWIPLTEEHVKAHLMDDEITAIEEAGDVDVAAKLPEIISQVTKRVRGRVAACSDNNPLGPADTIPDELLQAASIIAVRNFVAVVPGDIEEDGDGGRLSLYKQAEQDLKDVAACEIAIAPAGGSPQIEPNPSAFGGDEFLRF